MAHILRPVYELYLAGCPSAIRPDRVIGVARLSAWNPGQASSLDWRSLDERLVTARKRINLNREWTMEVDVGAKVFTRDGKDKIERLT